MLCCYLSQVNSVSKIHVYVTKFCKIPYNVSGSIKDCIKDTVYGLLNSAVDSIHRQVHPIIYAIPFYILITQLKSRVCSFLMIQQQDRVMYSFQHLCPQSVLINVWSHPSQSWSIGYIVATLSSSI